jgi:aminopeptidase
VNDPRIRKLAGIIVNYSTAVKKGDVVLISAVGEECVPLVKEVHRLCLLRRAAHVEISFSFPEITKDLYRFGTREQLSRFPRHKLDFLKKVDVSIGIGAVQNSKVYAGSDQELQLLHEKTLRPLLDRRVNHTRWVVCRYPTHGAAQSAGMSLEEYEDFTFRACNLDWARESRKQEPLRRLLERADRVQVEAPGTDLSFSLKGLPGVKADGQRNLPDGEVFSAPVRRSVEGIITFNCPTTYDGRTFESIVLEFSRGKAVKATCRSKEKALNRILDIDPGARYVGEFSFGTNRRIRAPVGSTLFDEKMFGSIHLALGNAYRRCFNGNRSAIHWDIVTRLGRAGRVVIDGKTVFAKGRFTLPSLAPLNRAR